VPGRTLPEETVGGEDWPLSRKMPTGRTADDLAKDAFGARLLLVSPRAMRAGHAWRSSRSSASASRARRSRRMTVRSETSQSLVTVQRPQTSQDVEGVLVVGREHRGVTGCRGSVPFALWVLIVCPAIGVISWWYADTDNDAIEAALLYVLPSALASVGGAVFRRARQSIAIGA
jgi:hypothetical protein